MRTLAEQMSTYQLHHTKESTKITHFIGVPCIIFGIQIVLSWFHVSIFLADNISFAWIAMIALLIYYLFLDVRLALVTLLFLLPLTYLAESVSHSEFSLLSFIVFCLTFIVGWAAQLIGHYYEGKGPAFLDNLFQALVAPIFLVAELVFALGYRKDLQRRKIFFMWK